jgi:cytochrome c-type biogenesis protein CcmH
MPIIVKKSLGFYKMLPFCRKILLVSCVFVLFIANSMAVVDIYEFDTASQRERYHALSEELRCPKCQNQNLAGSDSQIAGDLRRELHRLLLEGKTDREIKTYMVDRYGEFVLYKPRLQKATLVLWVLPFVLFVAGIFVLTAVVSRRKAKASEQALQEKENQKLSSDEQSELSHILATKETAKESQS